MIVSIGDVNLRRQYLSKIKIPATLIHPSAVVSPSVKISRSVIIEALAVVNTGVKIYEDSFICAGAVVNHNAIVGACCQVDCNDVVASFSEAPSETKVMSCKFGILINKNKEILYMNYLIVVAHPDDEVLGAGATIHRLVNKGNNVAVAIMVKQATARANISETLSEDQEISMNILGIKKTYTADFPNIKMNTVPHLDLVQFVERCIEDFKAEIIITHHPADANNDHVMTSYAVQAASRLFQRRTNLPGLKELLYMEIPSSTEWSIDNSSNKFTPNCFVEVKKNGVEIKLKALSAYKGVMREYPHPRSKEAIMGLAAYRGSQSGCDYAEAFETALRRIV